MNCFHGQKGKDIFYKPTQRPDYCPVKESTSCHYVMIPEADPVSNPSQTPLFAHKSDPTLLRYRPKPRLGLPNF